MRELKLGKKPASNKVTFKLKSLINPSALPKPPRYFGHEDFVGKMDWGMLANDSLGCCVPAGASHETMLWNAECGKTVLFDDKSTIANYSEGGGYNPNDPSTDQGCDMSEFASYRRKTGILDAQGNRHKIAAYVSITPGDVYEHYIALWLFGSLGIGIEFPSSAMDQINAGKSWHVVRNSPLEGGHYINLVARRRSLECVTWGQIQPMTVGFFKKYNDESLAYLSESMLTDRKSPEGFDYDGLLSMLNQLK